MMDLNVFPTILVLPLHVLQTLTPNKQANETMDLNAHASVMMDTNWTLLVRETTMDLNAFLFLVTLTLVLLTLTVNKLALRETMVLNVSVFVMMDTTSIVREMILNVFPTVLAILTLVLLILTLNKLPPRREIIHNVNVFVMMDIK